MLGSNLGCDTGCPEWYFSWFTSVSPASKCKHMWLSKNIFKQLYIMLITLFSNNVKYWLFYLYTPDDENYYSISFSRLLDTNEKPTFVVWRRKNPRILRTQKKAQHKSNRYPTFILSNGSLHDNILWLAFGRSALQMWVETSAVLTELFMFSPNSVDIEP
jgi:hypothetical protein